ncbi:MAG: SUMF1/EgtB/PvdO family nonheme iron enzyme [Anaerolineae bacterium]|nr:SUMF1/EgtB/PvdO family nonheme iron enzyme [Anaerolineae bacterium]
MSRNYGSLGRRSGGAGWQWMIIGAVLGFACAAVLGIVGVIAGVVEISGVSLAGAPSPTPVVITATALPATMTPFPTEVLVTPTSAGVQVEAPTATPTLDPTFQTLAPTSTPTTFPTAASQLSAPATVGSGEIDPILIDAVAPSEFVDVPGIQDFQMGTTPPEVSAAVDECLAQSGRCTVAMGEDSAPQHAVTLSPFRIERTEVSYAQFLAFMNYLEQTSPRAYANGCYGQPCLETNLDSETSAVTYDSVNYTVVPVISLLPVTEVTWYGARAYCEAIGRRLPTEAEWEYAARGTSGFIYPWGNDWDPTRAMTSRTADGSTAQKVDVNSFPAGASPFGVLNMAGNVSEWVFDWYDARFYGRIEATQPDPEGPASGTTKVHRGGSWDTVPFFARAVHRQDFAPNDGTPFIGFRCAADAETASASAAQGSGLLPGAIPSPDPALLGVQGNDNSANAAPTLPPVRVPSATPLANLPEQPVTPTVTLAAGS